MSLTVGYPRGIGLFLLLFMGCGFGGLPVAGQNGANYDYTCVQRGAHSRVWQASVLWTNGDGSLGTNFSSYTELTTGVCYLDPASGNYLDSVEAIEPTANGGQAVRGQYQVQWAGNANTSGGAVQLTTPNGRVMSSSVYGLSYWDVAAGTNVLIASLQDSIGAIVGLNQVIYTNAFS
ncbi:MAG TPA: hypothetical protein VH619_19170, partial [Verrucomicrobiae bacterium]|nr:hypothetical protein [Verrucomicrobiae bacterium]